MKYKVIVTFSDLQDFNHIYSVGDEYPRKGYSPTEDRIDELQSGKNLLHKPLITKVAEDVKNFLPIVEEEQSDPEETSEYKEQAEEKPEEPKKRTRTKK